MKTAETLRNSKALGRRVRKLREDAGMSQAQVAELTDLSIPYISHIETGKKNASVDTLIRISKVLHTSVDFLLDGRYMPEQNHSDAFQGLLEDCSPQEVAIICEIADALKNSIRKNL